MIKPFFVNLMNALFFKRKRALIFCIAFMLISLWIELYLNVNNFFSSSGTLFTIAGLFLSIKLTAIFHLKQNKDGKEVPLNLDSKHLLVTGGAGVFASSVPTQDKKKKVEDVESDEIYGIFLMIFGTVLWGYGSYFSIWLRAFLV